MRCIAGPLTVCLFVSLAFAEIPGALRDAKSTDRRLGPLRNLNGYFPFHRVDNLEQWSQRQAEIQRRILVSQGLWPLPTRSPLNAVVHGRVERDDYVVDRVYFESVPGHFVTGSLYRPKDKKGPLPAILSPHGHWKEGRFYDAGEKTIEEQLQSGAEQFRVGGRYPIQARAVQLARMGCMVLVYDMTGNADSVQLAHRPAVWSHLDKDENWGFMSVQADLRLQNMMGLQTWNSIRAVDFLLELPETDTSRIGVTGASGGGTQSMILAAIDERVAAAMPCVMVSTAMQGGCTCENAPLLRIDQGNVDIAAATAPRPLGLTAADDWTIDLETKGYPDLVQLYEMLGAGNSLSAVFHTQFKHNYNQVNRGAMYSFFNRHFALGLQEPIVERDYVPLSREEATVWNDLHPAPSGDQVGDAHEVRLLQTLNRNSEGRLRDLIPSSRQKSLGEFREIIGGAWETILGRRFDQVGDVSFTQSDEVRKDGVIVQVGLVEHVETGEQLPAWLIKPSSEIRRGTVIWVTDAGKTELQSEGQLIAPLRRLVESGYQVLAADLLGQGEFSTDQQPWASQRMWYQRGGDQGWHRFSGYTHGYNHCLFAQRVHDILTLIKLAQSETVPTHLVGLGRIAGPLAVAARSQSAQSVDRCFVDLDRFRFEDVKRHDALMFLPGAVKYLDVDGMLSLCAPWSLTVFSGSRSDTAEAVYHAHDASGNITFRRSSQPSEAVVASLCGD